MNKTMERSEALLPTPAPTERPRVALWERVAGVAALVAMFGAAATYALTAIAAICNYSIRQLMWDQYRMYGRNYLALPFPENVIQLENGHRPVVPVMVRVAEIEWGHASQLFQIVIGSSFALMTATLIASLCWCARTWSREARATGVFLAVVGLLWMANARMLLHGNEMLHAYTISLAVVCAAACVWKARGPSPTTWGLGAAGCATIAMFSFGPGVAIFPGLLVLATMLRTPWRVHAIVAATLTSCLALYLFLLPGEDGVRGMLHFRPVDSLVLASRWISSPWINAWLGLGDDPINSWLVQDIALRHPHSLLLGSASLAGRMGLDWHGAAPTVIGGGSLLLASWLVVRRLIRWERPSAVEAAAFMLVLFGAASALLIGLSRLDALTGIPSEVFADRYLVWPSLYWLGLLMLGLAALSRSAGHKVQFVAPVLGLALSVVLYDTHCGWIGWGASVHRFAERSAAAARSGVFDARVFSDDDAASRSDVLRTLELMQQRDLGMYADTTWHLRGTQWHGALKEAQDYQPQLRLVDTFDDAIDGKPAAYIEGWFPNAHGAPKRGWPLALLDSHDRIAGFAQFSFISPNAAPLRFSLPVKKGFDGYIRDFSASEHYRLIAIDVKGGVATVLAHLQTPAAGN